jgi:hypothetical protein
VRRCIGQWTGVVHCESGPQETKWSLGFGLFLWECTVEFGRVGQANMANLLCRSRTHTGEIFNFFSEWAS